MSKTLVHFASDNPNFSQTLKVNWSDAVDELDANQEYLRHLVSWTISGRDLIFSPRPEAMGVFFFCGQRIEVLPKYIDNAKDCDYRFLANIFFLTRKGPRKSALRAFTGRSQDDTPGILDYYFFLVLDQIYEFIRRYERKIHTTRIEETLGVRGRIRIMDSIRRYRGMKHAHICEVSHTQERTELLGLLRGLAENFLPLIANQSVKDLAHNIIRRLAHVPSLPFNKENFFALRRCARQIVMECRQAQSILDSLLELFEVVRGGIGQLSHKSFVFNMNVQFERIVEETSRLLAKNSGFDFQSGNENPLRLLKGESQGVSLTKGEDDFHGRNIAIKPDIILMDKTQKKAIIIDAKYKFLSYDEKEKSFSGVSSKDVQQLLTYWMHFMEDGCNEVHLALIYPRLSSQALGHPIEKAGKLTFAHPFSNDQEIFLNVFVADIQEILQIMVPTNDEANDAQKDWLEPILQFLA